MPQESPSSTKRKKGGNKEYVIVSYLFVAIFLSLIGYMVYFNVVKREDVINSPYNKRQNQAAEYVVRGDIRSSDGDVLATTEVDAEGNETRVYPYNELFAHAVGYFTNGKSGLESIANYELLTSHSFFLDKIKNEFQDKKNAGDTIVSTLNTNLQATAYNALGDRDGAVVVMEPSTGRILAMVSKPDFNPNTLAANWDSLVNDASSSSLVNRATQGRYAPGSTFKIVTALAYLQEHGNFDGFEFDCVGELTRDDHTIHCYNGNAHGQEDFYSAFASSCNSAFAQIGLDLGGSKLDSVSQEMLFNSKLPIELPYNRSSFSLDNNSGDALIMQTSFGQGNTLVSPMHMALITSAIANGGNMMETYFIDHIENANGDLVSSTKPKLFKSIMTSEESQQLTNIMKLVVQQGTASALNNDAYSVAGKTGSAEFFRSDGNVGTHSWFVGFSNVENPDIVVSVLAENSGTGSDVAVPIARQIFDAYYAN